MATDIYRKNNLQITRFYGGTKLGMCYQINVGTNYQVLTAKEFFELLRIGFSSLEILFKKG